MLITYCTLLVGLNTQWIKILLALSWGFPICCHLLSTSLKHAYWLGLEQHIKSVLSSGMFLCCWAWPLTSLCQGLRRKINRLSQEQKEPQRFGLELCELCKSWKCFQQMVLQIYNAHYRCCYTWPLVTVIFFYFIFYLFRCFLWQGAGVILLKWIKQQVS